MKKLMVVALAVASVSAFAHEDLTAKVVGYYDVTMTTKSLEHSVKTQTKTFTTKTSKGVTSYAIDQYKAFLPTVENLAGFEVVEFKADGVVVDPAEAKVTVKRITFKYSYYDFKVTKKTTGSGSSKVTTYTTNMVSKVVSRNLAGVYDSTTGKVYLWDKSSKLSITNGQEYTITDASKKTGVKRSGYVAYEVPLTMHKQFIKTQDNKAAGGFTGYPEVVMAEDGTKLDFAGLTAFGSGTFDANKDYLKTVSGNVAGKYPDDLKFGCYGTWKVNKDTKKDGDLRTLEAVLLNKTCVELVNELVYEAQQ